MTADILANLARKCNNLKEAQRVLELAHPMLMENVQIEAGRILTLRIKNAHWVRRQGWHKGKHDQWGEDE